MLVAWLAIFAEVAFVVVRCMLMQEMVSWAFDGGDVCGMSMRKDVNDALTIGRRHGRHMVFCSTMFAVMKMDTIRRM